MDKISLKFKEHSLTFWFINFYIILLVFLPKSYSMIGVLPIRLTAMFILIIIIVYEIITRKIKLYNNNYKFMLFTFILFIIFTIPSLFFTKNLLLSLYTVTKFGISSLLLFFILRIKFSDKEYKWFIKFLIIIATILSIYGVVQYIFDINLNKSGIAYYKGAKGRIGITFFNTIYYGIFINLIFGIIFYILCLTKNKKSSIYLIILCNLLYLNLIFTFTRSAILIFFISIIILIIMLHKISFNVKTLILIILFSFFTLIIPGGTKVVSKAFKDGYIMFSKTENLLNFLPGPVKNESELEDEEYLDYDINSDFEDYSLQHREEFGKIAKKIATKSKYIGVGFGSYMDYMNNIEFKINYPEFTLPHTYPHSSFILLYAEVGILALTFFVLFLIILLLNPLLLFLDNFKNKNQIFYLSCLILSVVCGFIIINMIAENAVYDTQIFPIFILVYGLLFNYCYKNKKSEKVLFLSSTGGHLSELLQLKILFKKYNSYLITEKTKSNMELKKEYNKVNYLLYGTKDHLFKYIFIFSYNCIKSIILYIKIRPDVIVTTGAHTSVPLCYISKLFGKKIIFIETFANSNSKTLSGTLIYPIANTFVVQWESMLKLYPKAVCWGWLY